MIKIAIPVKDENLTFFSNAGHTPKFAIFDLKGTGMFKSFTLSQIINNPRSDIDHEHAEEDHACDHAHDDEEHIAQHNKMGVALKDCNYIVVKKACKNTANSFTSQGIKLVKYNGEALDVNTILKETSISFK